ncbi:MAG TPA: winged helix-turn-helix domain-containing protein, partial [Chthoniobacteraceae bacterium]|nr:winged helix-turn-helix domain-containing protein [Chthoniobacteraceae bacterium]
MVYEFGDFRLDPAQHQLARCDGTPVRLKPRVFDTLLFLVENHGAVLDKERLMEAIWPDSLVEENNLTQNISALRRILDDTPQSHRVIVTVPGRGYRFAAEVKKSRVWGRNGMALARRTLAVLPFKPLMGEDRDESLELGMADTLIVRLSNIREIVVRPLGAVRRYVELDQEPRLAGRELDAESVLDGCIQKADGDVRVTVRLLDVASGQALWAGSFNERFTNIFDVQDAISEKVVAALSLQLSLEERFRLMKRYTESVKAYDLYLLGRHSWNKITPPEIRKSIGFFKQALALDPNYALAHAGLAEAYYTLPITSDVPPKEAFPEAKAAAHRAVEIDGALSHPHACLAFIHFWFDWDWAGAEREARRAIELDPHSGLAYLAHAHLLSNLGRHAEALGEMARARELEPLSLIINVLEGQCFYYAGRDEEALACVRRTLEIEPHFWVAHLTLGKVHLRQLEYAKAQTAFTRARQFSGDNSEAISMLGYTLARAGDEAGARAVLDEMRASAGNRY